MRAASKRPVPALWAAAAASILASCAMRPASPSPRAIAAPDASVAAYYAAPGAVPKAETTLDVERREFRVWKTSLPTRDVFAEAPDSKRPILFSWYEPTGDAWPGAADPDGRRPVVLVSPILGSDTDFVEGFAEAFARRGWHAAIVKRPKLDYDPSRPLGQVEEGMRLAVSRVRQVLDWFLARGDVDPRRVGSFGISAGAIVDAITAGSDDRYAAHVLALGGGPLADVLVESEESGIEKVVKKVLAKEGVTRDALREELRAVLRSDPVAFAPRVGREDVLMFVARFDRAVPTRYQQRLYAALGEPEAAFLPFGHYTSILALPWVRTRAVEFLAARFEARRSAVGGG